MPPELAVARLPPPPAGNLGCEKLQEVLQQFVDPGVTSYQGATELPSEHVTSLRLLVP